MSKRRTDGERLGRAYQVDGTVWAKKEKLDELITLEP